MTNSEQRLRDAGIGPEDVETQILGQDKALVITTRELVFLNGDQVQRGRLRDITNVKTAKTGELTVRSAAEPVIEGNILGFDRTELKFFFEGVKNAIARAKASVTNGSLPLPETPSPSHLGTSTVDDWQALTTPPASDPDAFRLPLAEAAPIAPEPEVAPAHETAPLPEAVTPNPVSALNEALEQNPPPVAPITEPVSSSSSSEVDPWTSTKQTFEVEPEKAVAPVAEAEAGWVSPTPTWDNSVAEVNPEPLTNQAPVAAHSWGGDTLDASKALGLERSELERPVAVLGTDTNNTLLAVGRWLKILAYLFFFSGTGFTATLFPHDADSGNIISYLVLLAGVLGSLLFSLMAWGLGEFFAQYTANMQDLRAIRRATLGH